MEEGFIVTLVMMTKNEDNTTDKLIMKATNEILNDDDDWIGIHHLSTPFTDKDVFDVFDEVTNKPVKVTYKTSKRENKKGEKDNFIQNIKIIN